MEKPHLSCAYKVRALLVRSISRAEMTGGRLLRNGDHYLHFYCVDLRAEVFRRGGLFFLKKAPPGIQVTRSRGHSLGTHPENHLGESRHPFSSNAMFTAVESGSHS